MLKFSVALSVVVALFPVNVLAHGEYDDWKMPGVDASCCDDKDCKVVAWRINRQAELELEVEKNVWIVPPRKAEIKDRVDPEGRAHWCGIVKAEIVTTYCYLPPRPPS